MENSEKLQDTASTTFYDAKKGTDSSEAQPIKPTFPEILHQIEDLNDRSDLIEMEAKISGIRKKLRANQDSAVELFELEDLKALVERYQLDLSHIREKSLEQQGEVRQQIERMLQSLEKQLQAYRKEWERLRVKCSNELNQEIEEIKIQKSSNEDLVTRMLKDATSINKDSINAFSQELKLSRKNRNSKVSKLLGQLESVKGSLNQAMVSEEAKRKEYDEIIYGLLEKTCENAESSIRRRVF